MANSVLYQDEVAAVAKLLTLLNEVNGSGTGLFVEGKIDLWRIDSSVLSIQYDAACESWIAKLTDDSRGDTTRPNLDRTPPAY